MSSAFSTGATKGFQDFLINCCRPNPRPVRFIPLQIVPSRVTASACTPLKPSARINPGGAYVVDEPTLQRVRMLALPNHKFPSKSSISGPAYGGVIPSAFPLQRSLVPTTWHKGPLSSRGLDRVIHTVPLWS